MQIKGKILPKVTYLFQKNYNRNHIHTYIYIYIYIYILEREREKIWERSVHLIDLVVDKSH